MHSLRTTLHRNAATRQPTYNELTASTGTKQYVLQLIRYIFTPGRLIIYGVRKRRDLTSYEHLLSAPSTSYAAPAALPNSLSANGVLYKLNLSWGVIWKRGSPARPTKQRGATGIAPVTRPVWTRVGPRNLRNTGFPAIRYLTKPYTDLNTGRNETKYRLPHI